MNTKFAEISDRSACAAWSSIPARPDLVVVASKVRPSLGPSVTTGSALNYLPFIAAGTHFICLFCPNCTYD